MTILRDELEITDFSDVSDGTRLAPVHPGEILLHDFMESMEVTQHRLAVTIGVPPRRINEIVHGNRTVTADTALRLSRFFGTSPEFWTSLQASYDTEIAKSKIELALAAIPRYIPKSNTRPKKLAA
jgi:addiction module HigA family antidote